MHHLHIFLSSPGDVSRERQLAREVIDQLESERAYKYHLKLELVAWDKPGADTAMPAQLEPQEAINQGLKKPSECDIVIVIFWARMGTPLSEKYHKPDGSRYRSGTEYEFIDAMAAARKAGKPDVLVYRCLKELSVGMKDPERNEKLRQWDLVEKFFSDFQFPDGSFRSFYKSYNEPHEFRSLLERNLRDLIERHFDPTPSEKLHLPEKSKAPTWDESKPPFPGLRAFSPKEALIFYGRGREIDELISKLSESGCRLMAVVGASGTGKSSLVAAGLLPALKKNAIPGSEDWIWLRFTPGEVGNNPFMALANSFKQTIERDGQLLRDVAKNLEADASKLKELLSMALEGKPEWAEVLIFIDQFEEFFSLVDSKYQDAFVNFLELVLKTERLRTVVTLRADFYHRCMEWPVLDRLLAEGHYPLLAPRMGALHEMINRPAERAGLQFEEGLAQRILDDTGTEPGALALMAFALFELWNESKEDGRSLTYAAYQSFNGVHGAIGKRAEDTFKNLEGEKTVLEAALDLVFRKLVEVDERGVATRRRALLSQITDGTTAETLVRAMTDARLLVTSQREKDSQGEKDSRGKNDEAMVEVAHEAIFTNWPRLSEWIDDHAGELRTCRSLTRAARDWQDAGAPRFSHLPDRATLRQYRKVWPACSLGEDVEEVQRFMGAARRRRLLWDGFMVLIVLFISLVSLHIWLRNQEMNWNVLQIWACAQIGLYDGPAMVEIPGTDDPFQMGSSGCVKYSPDSFELQFEGCPQHPVKIGLFWIGKYEVTFDEYSAFVLDIDEIKLPPSHEGWGRGSRPVINVSWDDARAYAAWLKEVTGKSFRLPTEAEWEYAVRAGTTTEYFFGDDEDKLGDYAWYQDNSGGKTHLVGQKKPNSWGLYDMTGNVWEWVEDDWHKNYKGAPPDGRAWAGNPRGAERVIRGGSWYYGAHDCRTAFRYNYSAGGRDASIGFRLARSVALGP